MNKLPQISCLMITGGEQNRMKLARIAVQNFLMQDYPNKKLIIINYNLDENVIDHTNMYHADITEYLVNKKNKTLGDLRNISLDMVPIGSFYYIFDDDDWRHPMLLSYMMDIHIKSGKDYIFLKNRLNYNCNIDSIWISSDTHGQVHILGRKKDDDFKYLSLNTGEDAPVAKLLQSGNGILVDNDPQLYTRFVHSSVFVRKNQTHVLLNTGHYQETQATDEDKIYVASFINLFGSVCNNSR